jgi:ubiquinone/menaquinone biosynthesis C-methylase UbiE
MGNKDSLKSLKTEGHIINHPAKTFDLFTFSRFRSKKTLAVLHPEEGESALDVGCGTGELACMIKELVGGHGTVAGIDPSANMIKVAMSKAEKLNLKIDFRLAAIEHLPFGDRAFDKVYSTLMTHHLPVKVKREGFREIRRVLKQGGKLLIFDIGMPSNAFIKLLALPFLFFEKHIFSSSDSIDVNIRGEIPDLLKQAGFMSVKTIKRDSLLLFGLLEYIIAE